MLRKRGKGAMNLHMGGYFCELILHWNPYDMDYNVIFDVIDIDFMNKTNNTTEADM
jgi:hypothetical protein